MTRVVVVANRDDGDDGYVGERLAELGFTFERCAREEPETMAAAEERADLVVLLGSDWSVYAEAHQPFVAPEIELARRAMRRGVPLLGICFGGQLVASALGMTVERSPVPEIGWRTLTSAREELCGAGPWFQYHFDRWRDEPSHAAFIANDAAPQGFFEGRTLALQFHPEVTPETVSRWLRAVPGEVASVGESIERIEAETEATAAGAKRRCFDLVDAFLEQVGRAAPRHP